MSDQPAVTLDDLRLVALYQAQSLILDVSTHPCGRCGHDSDDHLLDDSSNVSPSDPAARFACSFPAKHHGHAPVALCDCSDFITTLEADR